MLRSVARNCTFHSPPLPIPSSWKSTTSIAVATRYSTQFKYLWTPIRGRRYHLLSSSCPTTQLSSITTVTAATTAAPFPRSSNHIFPFHGHDSNQRRTMKSYIQILGTNTHDSMPSVLVHFDSQRYLINCGEGTQRFCAEHKIRWSNLQKVFLTRTHWDAMGGLPGTWDRAVSLAYP